MGWVFNATLRPLYPRECPGTRCTGGWVGHRAGLDGCGKTRPPPEFDSRTVQPAASRCTLSYPVIVQCAKSKLTLWAPYRDMRKMI
jgi:hypothetical protein